MEGTFTPREDGRLRHDRIENGLVAIAHGLLIITIGLLPIFFIPKGSVPLEYSKTFFVIGGLLGSVVLYGLAMLRSGRIRIALPLPVYALWGVAVAWLVSALLSGDRFDALFGNMFDTHTVAFMLVLAGVVTVPLLVHFSKNAIITVYMLLGASALILALFHTLRLMFGASFLSLGMFPTLVATPFGAWNSLALFFGLTILLSLIALEQLPLTMWGRLFFAVVTTLSLIMLIAINFFAIWIVLGLVSLIVLMYGLVKDRLTDQSFAREQKSSVSGVSLILSGLVFAVALIAVLGGSSFGSVVSNVTNVSFLEVRPSLGATLDVTRGALSDSSILGIGPNRFADAWRLYKDPAINTSLFWSVDFPSGYSYFASVPAMVGILGSLAWLVFLTLFAITGLRVVLWPVVHDRAWYFIGTSSFVGAIYLWGMALVYTPNAAAMLLAAFFTSTLLCASVALRPTRALHFSLQEQKRAALLLVGVVMVLIVGSVTLFYGTARHFTAVVLFNDAVQSVATGRSIEEVELQIERAFTLVQNDVFARQVAEYQLAKIGTLLTLEEPTEAEQQMFEAAITQGVAAAQQAVERDPTDGRNHAVAGALYSVLASIGIESTAERSAAAFEAAQAVDPHNPLYPLLEAQLAARTGNPERARERALAAVELKPNYTEALSFIAELDIAAGNVESAIDATQAILSLEPQNPARYFQLGILFMAAGSTTDATTIFEAAVSLDGNYANARYFLARLYAAEGNRAAARAQLEAVQELNPDNSEIAGLIAALDAGEDIGFATEATDEIGLPTTETEGVVTSPGDPDTSLVTPVNIGSGTETNTPPADSPASETDVEVSDS